MGSRELKIPHFEGMIFFYLGRKCLHFFYFPEVTNIGEAKCGFGCLGGTWGVLGCLGVAGTAVRWLGLPWGEKGWLVWTYQNYFQNSDHIFRYSNFSNLDTKPFRKINFKNFPNTKLFGKFYFLALERKKKFSEQFSVRKILKNTLFNSDLNLPPLLNLNLRI